MQHQIHFPGCCQCDLAHPLLKQVRGIEQAGQVMEDVLGLTFGPDAGDRKPGGLGLGAYDGKVLADKRVQQRGFADIRRAGKGDMTGPGGHPAS